MNTETTRPEHLFTEEAKRKRREGRAKAIAEGTIIPKGFYTDAIRQKCLDCYGAVPTEKHDCHRFEGYMHPCDLAPVRSRKLQREAHKPDLKRAIMAQCQTCLNGNPLWVCSSPQCSLYPVFVGPIHEKRGMAA